MKTLRMIVGIISMVLFLVIIFQSCAAGIADALQDNKGTGGVSGFFLAIFMLTAGIISVAARKSKGGAITAACFYGVGGLIGLTGTGSFGDLAIWSVLSFIFTALLIISVVFGKKNITT